MRISFTLLTAALLAGTTFPGISQTVPSTIVDKTQSQPAVRNMTGRELGAILRKGLMPGAYFSQVVLSKNSAFQIDVTVRGKSGQAEIHEIWDDNIFLQDGEARFVVGGAAVDAKSTAPGELRGTSIKGGNTMILRAGDYLFVPAGVPHQMFVDKSAKFIHFKTRKSGA